MEPQASTWLGMGKRADAGRTSVDTAHLSPGQRIFLACFLGAAFWNSICMIPLVFLTFKRYWSLYFWTMLFSNLGILICATEQVMNATMPGLNQMLIIVLASVGWPLMVTGQSLVLYSRLHMLFIKKRALRLVLCMIIFNALAIHSTGISLSIGLQFRRQQLLKPYSIFERINVTSFFIQETILSGLYLWKSRALLGHYTRSANRASYGNNHPPEANSSLPVVRNILSQLIAISIIVLCLDITILVLEYVGLYQLQLGYKVFAYSVKLQCEIYVLNRLQEFASRVQRLSGRNWDFQLSTVLQREWDSTLQKAFGSSSAQQDSESLSGSHAGDPPKRGNSGPGVPGGENTSQMDDRRRTVIVTEVQADEVMSRT